MTFPTDPVWMIQPQWLERVLPQLRGVDLPTLAGRGLAARGDPALGVPRPTQRVAVIPLVGVLQKYHSWLMDLLGGTAMLRTAAAVRDATADPNIGGILLYVDSPGGTVAGTQELADAVYQASAAMPVTAFISDLGASGAYYVASQARRVVANPAAVVGSVGVYSVIADWSKAAEQDGVKVHVVKAGAMKGIGVMGAEVTPEQLAELQRTVDAMHRLFVEAVSRGRKLPADQVRGLADGRVHIASEARRLGLIDAVGSLDAELQGLVRSLPAPAPSIRAIAQQLQEAEVGHARRGGKVGRFQYELRRSQPALHAAALAAGLLR